MRRWIAPGLSSLVLAAACNSILGIDAAEQIDASAATGGAGGSDASSGGAGTGAAAGAGGSAGSGSGGLAGAAGSAPCLDVHTDAKNCGWCGHDCGVFPCTKGECKPEEVTGIAAFTNAMRMDDGFIFVTGGLEAQFFRYGKQASTLEKWVTQDENYPLALYNGVAYFAEVNTNIVYRATEQGALAPTVLFTAGGEVPEVAADATGLYWQEQSPKKVRRSNLDGTNPVDFVTNMFNTWYMRFDTTDVYLGVVNDGVYRVAKNATLPVDGSTLGYFYDVLGDGPAALTLDTDAVYLSTGDPTYTFPVTTSQLLRITKSNQQESHLADSTSLILDIAVSDGYAYWVEEGTLANDYQDGAVRRVKIGDPAAQIETYASDTSHPIQIAVDQDYVWWLDGGWTSISGSIRRVRK